MLSATLEKKSISPLTGNEYIIPENPTDKEGIDAFIAANPGKKVVVVQGCLVQRFGAVVYAVSLAIMYARARRLQNYLIHLF